MKKKILTLIAIILTAACVMTACGKYPAANKITATPDMRNYAVIGNGGSVVQAGQYIYYINGQEDMTDSDGKSNTWGNVVKSGIFRAEIANPIAADTSKVINDPAFYPDPYKGYYGDYKLYIHDTSKVLTDDYSGFVMEPTKDYADKTVNLIKSLQIVPKKVYNGGYDKGGIYIFGDYIYYTSPNTLKNKQGEVQYELVDFYRTKHDGTGTQLLYTSTNADVKPQFNYYVYGGSTYLVIYDSAVDSKGATTYSIKTVKMTGKKVAKPLEIVSGATSVLMTAKPIWYEGITENQVEDFIYYTRATAAGDGDVNGNVVERVRPDGSDDSRVLIRNDGLTITLNEIKNGFLYYTSTNSISTSVFAENLINVPLKITDTSFTGGSNQNAPVKVLLNTENLTNIYLSNQIVSYDKDKKICSVTHFAIAVRNNATVCIVAPSSEERVILPNMPAKILAVSGNYMYFVEEMSDLTTATLYKANMFEENVQVPVFDKEIVVGGIPAVDVINGYVYFTSTIVDVYKVEDKANETYKTTSNYMMVKRDTGLEHERNWLLAVIADKDVPEADPDEEE